MGPPALMSPVARVRLPEPGDARLSAMCRLYATGEARWQFARLSGLFSRHIGVNGLGCDDGTSVRVALGVRIKGLDGTFEASPTGFWGFRDVAPLLVFPVAC